MDFYRERVNNKPVIIACVSSAVCIVFLLGFLVFRLNTIVGNVNDTLYQSQFLMSQMNQTNLHFNQLVETMQQSLPNVNTFLTEANEVIPHVDSLIIQVNSSLPVYTNAVTKLNFTEIQNNIYRMTESIANLTILANRVAHFFHI